jgi:hypothetical protein
MNEANWMSNITIFLWGIPVAGFLEWETVAAIELEPFKSKTGAESS